MRHLAKWGIVALALLLAAPLNAQTVDTTQVQSDRQLRQRYDWLISQLRSSIGADSAALQHALTSRGQIHARIVRDSLRALAPKPPIGEPVDTTPAPPPPPADTTPAPPPPPPADTTPQPALLFKSDWSTALGSSTQAVRDGNRWPEQFCTNARGVVDVVAAAPLGFTLTQNVLRARYLTESDCLEVQTTIPGTGDYYVRAYIRNDVRAGGVITWHPFVVNVAQPYVTFWLNHGGSSAGNYSWQIRGYYPTTGDNNDITWGRDVPLGVWLRFEWHVQFTQGNDFRLWPRVYDMSGTLIADANSLRRTWTNSTQTLAQWYAAGGAFRMPSMSNARKIGIGTEGPAGARNTGEAWYYAALAVGTSWIGAAR